MTTVSFIPVFVHFCVKNEQYKKYFYNFIAQNLLCEHGHHSFF